MGKQKDPEAWVGNPKGPALAPALPSTELPQSCVPGPLSDSPVTAHLSNVLWVPNIFGAEPFSPQRNPRLKVFSHTFALAQNSLDSAHGITYIHPFVINMPPASQTYLTVAHDTGTAIQRVRGCAGWLLILGWEVQAPRWV